MRSSEKKLHKMKAQENASLNSFQTIGTIFKEKFVLTAKKKKTKKNKHTSQRLFFDVGVTMMFILILVKCFVEFLLGCFCFLDKSDLASCSSYSSTPESKSNPSTPTHLNNLQVGIKYTSQNLEGSHFIGFG